MTSKKYLLAPLVLGSLVLFGCGKEGERKIRLADQPVTALNPEQVESIELAVSQKKKVALVDFQNQSQSSAEWLRGGIMQKLRQELELSRQLNLNPSRFVQDVLDSLNLSGENLASAYAIAQVAQKVDADVLIRGAIYFDEDLLNLDVELYQKDGSALARFSRAGMQTDTLMALNTIVSQMAFDIRRELEVQSKGPSEVEITHATASTTSKEALKLYIDGQEMLDQFYMADALPLFERAVQLDTTFASAYSGLAHAYMSVGQYDQARQILHKAMQHSANLPDRERVPIEASYAMMTGEYYKAIELYNHLLELYPEDYNIHYQIGQYYFSIAHDYHKAIEKFETVIELYPKHKMAHNQLAYAYAYVGELDHALFVLDKYAELAPDEPNPFDSYGELLKSEGRLDEAIDMFRKALKINPDFWHSKMHLAAVYSDMGRTRKARKLLTEIEADSTYKKVRATTTQQLALNEIVAGDLDKAEDYLRKAADEEPENLGYYLALLYIKPEKEEYQQWFVDEMEHQVQLAQKDSLEYDRLLGMVSRALSFNLGVDLVDKLLDNALEGATDPILSQIAAAYKLILDFRNGRSTAQTEKYYASSSTPEAFQYARPASWNDYWRHYFDALRIAAKNNVPVGEWADGFYQFSQASGNQHFVINGAIAVAASEFYSGNSTTAIQKLNDVGIPCEANWKFVGPFNLEKGFHQQFWPEKVDIEKWSSKEKYSRAIFQKRDDLFDGYINVKQITNFSTNQAVYALLDINSKNYKLAQLRFGMGGRLKVWLNGEPVMIKNVRGDAVIDRYIANVRLHLGPNTMLVRVDNVIGELGFYFRVTDLDGNGDNEIEFNTPRLMAHIVEEENNVN